jgi:hypothetical protein
MMTVATNELSTLEMVMAILASDDQDAATVLHDFTSRLYAVSIASKQIQAA